MGQPRHPRDATVTETPSVTGVAIPADAHTWKIHVCNSFTDVPSSYRFYTHIERLVHNEVTLGTGGFLYSPNNVTPRIQMAAFLARSAAGGALSVPVFGTISDGNGDGTFSPNANVSRGQMAKFLVNAFNLSINNPRSL